MKDWNAEAKRLLPYATDYPRRCVAAALAKAEALGADGKRGHGIVYWKTYAKATEENWKVAVGEINQLRAERDAAVVQGLETAKAIVECSKKWGPVPDWIGDTIQAEIDKQKKAVA